MSLENYIKAVHEIDQRLIYHSVESSGRLLDGVLYDRAHTVKPLGVAQLPYVQPLDWNDQEEAGVAGGSVDADCPENINVAYKHTMQVTYLVGARKEWGWFAQDNTDVGLTASDTIDPKYIEGGLGIMQVIARVKDAVETTRDGFATYDGSLGGLLFQPLAIAVRENFLTDTSSCVVLEIEMMLEAECRGKRSYEAGTGGEYEADEIPLIIADAEFYINAADSDTITEVAGKVSSWADKSSNERDFLQASALEQPTYSATAMNGHPGVVFTEDLYMEQANFPIVSGPFTAVAVVSVDSTGSEDLLFGMDQGQVGWDASGYWFANAGTTLGGSAADSSRKQVILTAVLDDTNSLLYQRNVEIASGASGGVASMTKVRLGNADPLVVGQGLDGVISALVVYNEVLSTAAINELVQFFSEQFDI